MSADAFGQSNQDSAQQQDTERRLRRADPDGLREVEVMVAGPNILIFGCAPDEQRRTLAEFIARNTTSRRILNVIQEIVVGDCHRTNVRRLQDGLIATQVRSRIRASPIDASDIQTHVFEGTVYMMGSADEVGLRRAAEIASVVGGVRRVVSFVQAISIRPENGS